MRDYATKKKNHLFRIIGSLKRLIISIFSYKFSVKKIAYNSEVDEIWVSNPVRRLQNENNYNKYVDPYFNKLSSKKALMVEKNHSKDYEYTNHNLKDNHRILNIQGDYLLFSLKNIRKNNLDFDEVVEKYNLSLLSDFFTKITTYDFFLFVQDFIQWHNYYSYLFNKFPNLNKVVFIAYGSTDNLAINSISKFKNIETVDLQHGVQTDQHTEYSRWGYLTKEVFKLLPTSFYVFTEKERILLNKTFKNNCRYRVVGDLALETWLNQNKEISIKKIVLVSLQSFIIAKDHFIYDFFSYLNSKFPKLEIVFREHPSHRFLKDKFDSILREKNILYKWDTQPNVYDTLSNSILNITSFSSVVNDASKMNVPSFIIDKVGAVYYKEEINDSNIINLVLSKEEAVEEFVRITEGLKNV